MIYHSNVILIDGRSYFGNVCYEDDKILVLLHRCAFNPNVITQTSFLKSKIKQIKEI